MIRSGRDRRSSKLTFAVGVLLVAGSVGSLPVSAAPPLSRPTGGSAPLADLGWTPCYPREGSFECAELTVPLDYDAPGGTTIPIALIRQQATNPAQRIGSVLVNPGGPGGSGVDFVRFVGPALFTAEVRARFDIIGFDPRGIARSRPLKCFEDESQWGPYFTPFAFPLTDEERRQWIASDRYLLRACDARASKIIDHMATADVARDMERIRRAVGDPRLNYVGYSYGSYLGVTYANLFPGRFRSIVVDGVLDPVQWSTGTPNTASLPFAARLGSDIGTNETAAEFFRLCDDAGKARCAFAPNSARRFRALARRLLDGPVIVTEPGGEAFEYNYSFLIADTTSAMYSSESWPFFAELLAAVEDAEPAAAGDARVAFHQQLGITPVTFERYENFIEGFPGVACSDSNNPDRYRAWVAAAAGGGREVGYYRPFWTWLSSICAEWRGFDADRYMGPFTASTATSLLLIGNRFDPATPYSGAQTVDALMPRSRLLTVRAWGHTSGGISTCTDQVVARYLIDRALPPVGTVCAQDVKPFSRPPDLARAAGVSEVARAIAATNLAPLVSPR